MLLSQWGEGLDTERERQTDRQRERQTDRQADRQRHRQRQTEKQWHTGIQPHKVTRVDKGIEQ